MVSTSSLILGFLIGLLTLASVGLLLYGLINVGWWTGMGFIAFITSALCLLAYRGFTWTLDFDERNRTRG